MKRGVRIGRAGGWRVVLVAFLGYGWGVRTIYLDYNASAPLDRAVRDAMVEVLDRVQGNPSSVHRLGREARAVVDEARDRLAGLWKSKPSEVVFTSGGTESNNLAILGVARLLRERGRHLITTAIEHPAVLNPCRYLAAHEGFTLTELPVTHEGQVEVETVLEALRPDTILVSVMAANNEVGSLQPIPEIGRICRDRGVVFHTDAIQWFGKEAFHSMAQFEADLVSVSAHKFYGPKGSGALFVRSPLLPRAILLGGGQENERRAGTENPAGIQGLAEAFGRFVPQPVFDRTTLAPMVENLRAGAERLPGLRVFTPRSGALTNTLALSVEGTDSLSLLAGLDLEGLCVSSGSACSAGSLEPSHVLQAMGATATESTAMLRFSLGRESSGQDIEACVERLGKVVDRIRGSR